MVLLPQSGGHWSPAQMRPPPPREEPRRRNGRERLMTVMGEFHAAENSEQAPEHWRGQTGLGEEVPEGGGF